MNRKKTYTLTNALEHYENWSVFNAEVKSLAIQSIWYEIIVLCYRLNWPARFNIHTEKMVDRLPMANKKTFLLHLNRMIESGLLVCHQRPKNQKSPLFILSIGGYDKVTNPPLPLMESTLSPVQELMGHFNKVFGLHTSPSLSTEIVVSQRLKTYSIEQIKQAIDKAASHPDFTSITSINEILAVRDKRGNVLDNIGWLINPKTPQPIKTSPLFNFLLDSLTKKK